MSLLIVFKKILKRIKQPLIPEFAVKTDVARSGEGVVRKVGDCRSASI